MLIKGWPPKPKPNEKLLPMASMYGSPMVYRQTDRRTPESIHSVGMGNVQIKPAAGSAVAGFLLGSWRTAAQSNVQGCEVYFLDIDPSPRRPDIIKAGSSCELAVAFKETVELTSPDGNYTLRLVVSNPDWKNQTVQFSAQPFLSGQRQRQAYRSHLCF